MLNFFSDVFKILTPQQRLEFQKLQILILLMAVFEMIGVLSISPFMMLVSDQTIVFKDGVFQRAYEFIGFSSVRSFTLLTGISALIVLAVSASVSMYTVWSLSMFANRVGAEIGDKLYEYYLSSSWLFHTKNHSANLTQKISVETTRLTSMILVSTMRLNARIIVVLILTGLIFFINPEVAISALLIFGFAYYILFKFVRKKLSENSEIISKSNQNRFVLMSEAFGAIKDVLLMNKQLSFLKRFQRYSYDLAKASGLNQAMVEVPRFFMELITFSAIVMLILYLYSDNDADLSTVLPLLSIYALAGFKMLPAFQQIYRSLGQIKGNMAAFYAIKEDLDNYVEKNIFFNNKRIKLTKSIELSNVLFHYPQKKLYVLNHVNIEIPALKTVGLVGASGSGKSTVLDMILGLIEPESGKILIDGRALKKTDICSWQRSLGYVSQHIYLSDRSLVENVAFGEPLEDIDIDKVMKSLSLAHLDNVISEWPDGINTVIGEQGMQLSGGQRQRLGIARALYRDPEVLFFDEATSSLDGVTEKAIMDAIYDFSGKKTILLIAHRLKTVMNCDLIYVMDNGKIIASGSYDELVNKNDYFKTLAKYS